MPAKKIVLSDTPALHTAVAGSLFCRAGFTLIPVRSGDALYRMAEAEAPALVIIDLALHGAEGLDCCRRIKQDRLLGETPVMILLPAGGRGVSPAACREAGCDAVVGRPLEASALLDGASALLGISRRLQPRLPVDLPLTFTVSGRRQHAATVVNLNAGGLFMAAGKLLPAGSPLRLELVLPGVAERLVCQGRVAWVNHPEWRKKIALPDGMGVCFDNPAADFTAALGRFLSTLSGSRAG